MIKPHLIKKWTLAILMMASCSCLAESEIYKIVDSAGRVIYTDTPPAEDNADQLKLRSINQIPTPQPSDAKTLATDAEVFSGYSIVDLVAPTDNSLIHYDQEKVIVSLALTPELQPGHLVQFYLDGAAYGRPVRATSSAIGDLQRGSHTVSARLLNEEGETVANSRSVRVNVQRHFKRKNQPKKPPVHQSGARK